MTQTQARATGTGFGLAISRGTRRGKHSHGRRPGHRHGYGHRHPHMHRHGHRTPTWRDPDACPCPCPASPVLSRAAHLHVHLQMMLLASVMSVVCMMLFMPAVLSICGPTKIVRTRKSFVIYFCTFVFLLVLVHLIFWLVRLPLRWPNGKLIFYRTSDDTSVNVSSIGVN